ncbi:MAG: NAD(P)H-binding protein [Myxococcales bacterium]|nr:NAD(P)H-binding protein [Myxococcales bacterium]
MTEVRAFVAGATGHTGREVVRELRARGVSTVAHVRPDSSRLAHWRASFAELGAEVDVTAFELDALCATFERLAPTHVFSCLGTTRARAKQVARAGDAPPTYDSVDYGLTALLVDALAQSRSEACFVYISAAGISPNTRSAYMRARVKAEAHIRESGLAAVIARPSFIVGDRDERRVGEHVGSVVGDAVLGVLGAFGARKLRARYRSTTGAELARALVAHALDHGGGGVSVIEADDLRV